ncbi:Uncharacterized protein DBV15_04187 [Temnothorax longispinosus]|uniref:Uncharacterized protein n=1 Tax=Temnothorax longispinosus TaxID=300112 RepID=A0A4S2KD92_9HYME|nr:Uncharacterized protein DBV15_04187 [Temnothorax longispinosus]
MKEEEEGTLESQREVPLIWQRQPSCLERRLTFSRRRPMGEDLNGRLCGQPRKLVTSAFSAKSFPCSALPIVAGSSTVKLLLRFRPRVFRGIRGRQNDDERPPVRPSSWSNEISALNNIPYVQNIKSREDKKKSNADKTRSGMESYRGQDLWGWFLRTNYIPIPGMKEETSIPG